MTELHLVGYTADLTHLVLDVVGADEGPPYRLVVDADLILTVEELRRRRREAGLDPELAELEWPLAPPDRTIDARAGEAAPARPGEPTRDVAVRSPPAPDPPAGEPHNEPAEDDPTAGEASAPPEQTVHGRTANGPVDAPADERTDAEVTERDRAADASVDGTGADEPDPDRDAGGDPVAAGAGDAEADDGDVPRRSSALTPAQIQAQLRAGRSPRSVAKAAGTDVAWVERWLAPILEERHQALTRARSTKLERQRLGRSRLPLGAAVQRNLQARKVDPAEASWSARRRNDGSWTVTVRYRSRGRQQSASWRMDADAGEISACSQLARDLGFVAPAKRRSSARR